MDILLALFAAVGVVATVYYLFGAVFLRASVRKVVSVAEVSGDEDIALLSAMWVTSFLVGSETILLPRDKERFDALFPREE
ncbi:MAG: hypothetical protein MJ141_03095 [Clostridia bacterium]|nr:hypothetical protein [Clostridia bacterium]